MPRYGKLDYPTLTKRGFGLGIGLFLLGAMGEVVDRSMYGTLPAWEATLFFDLEVVGVLLALFAPLVFGIVMPLTE
jgi:hypothetical protein